MSVVVSFPDITPPARYDDVPWNAVHIEEAPTESGTYAEIDELPISPVDDDPAEPAARNFTTSNGTDVDLWYRLIFEDGDGGLSSPTAPVQNIVEVDAPAYATTAELARLLKIRTPSAAQTVALQRELGAARTEIDAELGLIEPLEAPYPPLVVEVNLARAQELWQFSEATLGFIGLGSETGPARIASNTWEKHAQNLAPLKETWGLA